MIIGKKIYKISHWIHKYLGLILLLFLAWMSLSGVILNHPSLIKKISISEFLVPKHYHPDNWNRSAMKGIEQVDANTYLTFGYEGVYISRNKGNSFTSFMAGDFPHSAWERRTNHLVHLTSKNQILAATNSGLYISDLIKGEWRKIILPANHEPVQKILLNGDTCIVVTRSAIYTTTIDNLNAFNRFLPEKVAQNSQIPMFRVFLQLHDGSIWGLPGKLLWDIAGLILFFLSISAFYIWYYPKKWKRRYIKENIQASKSEKELRSLFLKYHKKFGWYSAILLITIILTGIFLRPPFLIAIAQSSILEKYYPEWKHSNPWHKKINNALFDSKNNLLVLECDDGLWAGDISGRFAFERLQLPIPISAMGAKVFEEEKAGVWLVGSFSGLFRCSLSDNRIESLLNVKMQSKRGRPSSIFVTGIIKNIGGEIYILDHYKGLSDLKGNRYPYLFPMPQEVKEKFKMPLWNWLFELHNARIFRGIMGQFYMLVIPLLGMASLFILISGIFDYWYVRIKKSRQV